MNNEHIEFDMEMSAQGEVEAQDFVAWYLLAHGWRVN